MCSTPGQKLQNAKVPLIASKKYYQRLLDYTIDKKIDHSSKDVQGENMTKTIRNPKKEELLAKRKKADDETIEFMKNVEEEKAAERALIIKEAKNLLLQKTPLCRGIDRALLQSECLRELDVQLDFQKKLKTIDKDIDKDYTERMKLEVEKYETDEKNKSMEKAKKNQEHGIELKKQIDAELSMKERMTKIQFEMEQLEHEEIEKQLQIEKELQMKKLMEQKQELQKLFLDAREQARRHEEELKRDIDLDDKITDVYRKAKDRIRKMHKLIEEKSRKEKFQTSTRLDPKLDPVEQLRQKEEQENAIMQKVIEQRETIEKEKIQARKNHEQEGKLQLEKYRQELALERENRDREAKELLSIEVRKRFEKVEFDKKYEETTKQLAKQRKKDYAAALQDQIGKQKAIRQDTKDIDHILQREIDLTNQQILTYAEGVLEESKGVRPVYPIYKAIEECKKDMGLIQRPTHQTNTEPNSREISFHLS